MRSPPGTCKIKFRPKPAYEEVEKDIVSMRQMLSGDGEAEPNQEQITLQICKETVLSLFIYKLLSLGWDYMELPNFNIASHVLATFKELLAEHQTAVVHFLGPHYEQVFVANPNKPCEITKVLANNHAELLMLLHNLPTSKAKVNHILHSNILRTVLNWEVRSMPNRTDGEPGRFRRGKRHTLVPGKKERKTEAENERRGEEERGGHRRKLTVALYGRLRVAEAVAAWFA
ncbi:hypothetical protein COCNU_16G001500 [Cocos nucifera]|uniref:Uncharacterized protein n=1 Tax=Cocos nucifera TaxID=13894 RepID=A0A8K0IXP4_COCNU|nr:hypothetical protein COCNU_16G001500 [Cocos nucifera]